MIDLFLILVLPIAYVTLSTCAKCFAYRRMLLETPTPLETPLEIPVETPLETPVETPLETPVEDDPPPYSSVTLGCPAFHGRSTHSAQLVPAFSS